MHLSYDINVDKIKQHHTVKKPPKTFTVHERLQEELHEELQPSISGYECLPGLIKDLIC